MIPIHPIHEESCRPHYGRLVCAVMNDGTRHIGVLSRVENGKLILNEQSEQPDLTRNAKLRGKKTTVKAKRKKTEADLAAFAEGPWNAAGFGPYPPYPTPYPYYPYGNRIVLDLALLTLLFLVIV